MDWRILVAAFILIMVAFTIYTESQPETISLNATSLRLSSSCNAATPVANSTTLEMKVPANGSCSFEWPEVASAMGYTPFYNVTSIQFTAAFKGRINAPNNDIVEQMVISMNNGTTNEFGIYAGLNSGILFGYIEDNQSKAYPTVVLMRPSNNTTFDYWGRFRITMSYSNGTNVAKFYVDKVLVGEARYAGRKNFTGLAYYPYIATERWGDGWNSSDDSMEISNLSVTVRKS